MQLVIFSILCLQLCAKNFSLVQFCQQELLQLHLKQNMCLRLKHCYRQTLVVHFFLWIHWSRIAEMLPFILFCLELNILKSRIPQALTSTDKYISWCCDICLLFKYPKWYVALQFDFCNTFNKQCRFIGSWCWFFYICR